jgi:signal transduction histidine kinase
MKTLRRFIAFNMTVLLAAALGIAFWPDLPFPVSYAAGSHAQDLSRVHILAITIAGMAIALLAQSALSLVGELRKLAFCLGFAYGLIAFMVFFEQLTFGGHRTGWLLMAILLAIAAAFAWMGRRPLRPEEAADELSALKIPDEIRRGVLRQIEESAAQEERNRLARDLHDSIKQQLFSINVGTAATQERWDHDPEGARKALADVRRSAREAMVEMQAMLHQLRPEALSTAGLTEALREQCEALGYRTGAEVKLEIGEPVPDDRMPPGTQDALFRIGQEMLANVARHARAQHVRLWLGRQDEEVMLRIVDDGQGFDPTAEASGMGLRNLKERAASLHGTLEVASTPGSGAGLTVRIPLVSPPLPSPAEGGRRVLSEFLALSVAAGLVSYPLWTGPGAEGASEGFGDASVTPWTFEVTGALVLLLLTGAAWWTGRSSPRNVRSFVTRKFEILLALFVGVWWLDFASDFKAPTAFSLWALPAAAVLYAAGALVSVHRVGEVRRVWQKGARFWLLPLLPVALTVGATVAWAFERPDPLTLKIAAGHAFFLVIGFVFPYLVARRPRGEGASS